MAHVVEYYPLLDEGDDIDDTYGPHTLTFEIYKGDIEREDDDGTVELGEAYLKVTLEDEQFFYMAKTDAQALKKFLETFLDFS